MASKVHSIGVNGKLSNSLKDQKIKFNTTKLNKIDGNLYDGNDSIDNLKKLMKFSSYTEENVQNSANTLKWDDESDDFNNLTDEDDSGQCSNDFYSDNNLFKSNKLNEMNSMENQLNRSVMLRKNYEDLTQIASSPSIYEDHDDEDKYMIKCPSCPEKVFRKTDDLTIFDNSNNDEIDFYTNEKVVSNNCWSEISKLRHFASNLELYTTDNKKSELTFNFLEEFALKEGVNYLSDFGFHNSHDQITTEDGFYPLRSSNDYIHDLMDTDSSSEKEDDSDTEDIKKYISNKRKMIQKLRSDSSSIEYQYSFSNDINGVDDSKNTLISSFNSLQINQRYKNNDDDEEENEKIMEVFDFIKEYKKMINSVSIKYDNNKIIINGKPLENRIHNSLDEYQEIKMVGNGAYGKLVECIHIPTNKRVILKKIPVNNINHWYINNVMTMEEYSLRKNIHPRIIALHDAFFYYPISTEKEKEKSEKSPKLVSFKNPFKNLNRVLRGGKKKKRKDKEKGKEEENNKNTEQKEVEDFDEKDKNKEEQFILVTESIGRDCMDLYDYIETIGPIPENNVKYIFAQIIEAVYFMSKNGFSHGDIKDENILINPSTFEIKLIDFGSATTNIGNAEIPYSKFRGTRKYQAPNIYKKDTFDPLAQDVWSLGVMLFVMLFAADPFTSPEEAESVDILEQLHENIQYIRVEKNMTISEEAADLIMKMLEKDETARITLEEIIYHNFFRN